MIQITKVDGYIGIKTTPAKQSIDQPKADFDLKQQHIKVQIDTEQVQVRIDQRQCFNESGRMDMETFTKDNVSQAKQAATEGIDRIVAEGNRMAAIENKTDAIAEISASNFIQLIDFNFDIMPKSRPIIDFVGGNVDIRIDGGHVELNTKPNKPVIDVEVGKVDISMKQWPSIKIEFVGKEIDKSI